MSCPTDLSFKAYLRQKGSPMPKEVRRFGMWQLAVTNFKDFQAKVQSVFPSLAGRSFSISWKDCDGDDIIISSDEELMTALTECNEQVRRIYIDLKDSPSISIQPSFEIKPVEVEALVDLDIPMGFGDADAESGAEDEDCGKKCDYLLDIVPKEHHRVVCDGCNMRITTHRYKCVECPNYDLCLTCESQGLHSDHIMARIPLTNSYAAKHPQFMKGIRTLNEAMRKIQHRRKKSERRFAKIASNAGEIMNQMSNDYYEACLNYGKHMQDATKHHKSDHKGKKEREERCRATSSAAQSANPGMDTENASAAKDQPSTAQGGAPRSCPAVGGLFSSILNVENMAHLQRLLEHITPVPEQLLQEVARSFAGANLNDEPASEKTSTSTASQAPRPSSGETGSSAAGPIPATAPSTSPSIPAVTSDPIVALSAGNASEPSLSSRCPSSEPDTEGWTVVEPPNVQKDQEGVYPKLPAADPTPAAATANAPSEQQTETQIPQPRPVIIRHRDPAVRICLETLASMGYNVDDQFIVDVAEARHGDVSRVLDMLA